MRHGKRLVTLGLEYAKRWQLIRNLLNALLKHERIETTYTRAKYLSRIADKVITCGKRGIKDVPAYRRVQSMVHEKSVIKKLFEELAPRYLYRDGGYTRVVKSRYRPGDFAHMAFIEFVGRNGELRKARPPPRTPLPAFTELIPDLELPD